jgi:hypothetical protein
MSSENPVKDKIGYFSAFGISLAIALRGATTYAPFTEGWWHVYARWLNQGKMPYRDFELLVPPGYPLLLRSVIKIFGETFYTLRIIGAVQIALIGVCIFVLTSRIAGQALAVLFSAAAVSYLVSGTAFVSYDYVYTALLLMLASFSYVLRLMDNNLDSPHLRWRSWVMAGFLVGWALSIKQTQGLWTFLGVIVLLFIFQRQEIPGFLKRLALIGLGIAVVWLPLSLWLLIADVTPRDFVRSLYLNGGPKGSATKIFFGWARGVFNLGEMYSINQTTAHWLTIFQSLLLFLAVAAIVRKLSSGERRDQDNIFVGVAMTGIWTVGVALWSINPSRFVPFTAVLDSLWDLALFNADARTKFWIIQPFFLMWLHLTRPPKQVFRHALALSICSMAVVWACGMSLSISEIGDFLAIAVSMSFFVLIGRRKWLAVTLAGLMALSVASGSLWKKDGKTQYDWWRYETPIPNEAIVSYEQGLMTGLKTTPEIRDLYEKYRSYITASDDCPGEIVAFPHVPLFLLDINSTPKGRLGQYWYDFSTSDEIIRETQRLESVQFKAIVIMQLPPEVREMHEQFFSEGRALPHQALGNLLLEKSEGLTQVLLSQVSTDAFLKVSVSDCVVKSMAGSGA